MMATFSKPVDYEFVDQVPEDYFCKRCKHVAIEPNIISCCGETFCKGCIEGSIQDIKKTCPSCQETDISFFPQKKHQAKVLALKVYCLMKGRGCEWTGQLQHLDAHLHPTTGDCVYVKDECDHSPEIEVLCSKQMPKTKKQQALVVASLGDSQEEQQAYYEQKLQKQQQTFDQLLQKNEQELQQSFDQKLLLQQQSYDRKLLGKQQESDEKFKALEDKQKELKKKVDDQKNEYEAKLQVIEELEASLVSTQTQVQDVPLREFTFSNYQRKKGTPLSSFKSPLIYTHPKGYQIRLIVWPYGQFEGARTHVSVAVYLVKGDFDDQLKFPAKLTLTLELLNQHRDQDHHSKDIKCEVTKEKIGRDNAVGVDHTYIANTDLEWSGTKKTQYLKDNCLKFRVSKVVLP